MWILKKNFLYYVAENVINRILLLFFPSNIMSGTFWLNYRTSEYYSPLHNINASHPPTLTSPPRGCTQETLIVQPGSRWGRPQSLVVWKGMGLGLRNFGLQAKPVILEGSSPASVPSSVKWGQSRPLLLRAAAGAGEDPKWDKGWKQPFVNVPSLHKQRCHYQKATFALACEQPEGMKPGCTWVLKPHWQDLETEHDSVSKTGPMCLAHGTHTDGHHLEVNQPITGKIYLFPKFHPFKTRPRSRQLAPALLCLHGMNQEAEFCQLPYWNLPRDGAPKPTLGQCSSVQQRFCQL